jgi:hypothetical protein
MKDDELLNALASQAREEDARRQRQDDQQGGIETALLERLAAGTLTDEERSLIDARAADSPDAAAVVDACRPLDPALLDGLVDRIADSLAEDEKGEPPAVPPVQATPGTDPSAATPKVVAFPERHRRVRSGWFPLAVAASLTAALVLPVMWMRPGAELPGYQLSFRGVTAEVRSAAPTSSAPPPERVRVDVGNAMRIVITPDSRVDGDVTSRIYVVNGGAAREATGLEVTTSEDGAVLIAGRIGEDVELASGESTLVIIVGRPGALPDVEALVPELAASGTASADRWSAFAIDVEFIR